MKKEERCLRKTGKKKRNRVYGTTKNLKERL